MKYDEAKISVSGFAAEGLVINFEEHYTADRLDTSLELCDGIWLFSKLEFKMAAHMVFELWRQPGYGKQPIYKHGAYVHYFTSHK